MPSAPAKPCRRAGCPELVRDRRGYCDRHQKEAWSAKAKDAREQRPEDKQFYDSSAWRKFRLSVLKAEPWCRECRRDNRMKLADVVDHVTPIRLGGAKLDGG